MYCRQPVHMTSLKAYMHGNTYYRSNHMPCKDPKIPKPHPPGFDSGQADCNDRREPYRRRLHNSSPEHCSHSGIVPINPANLRPLWQWPIPWNRLCQKPNNCRIVPGRESLEQFQQCAPEQFQQYASPMNSAALPPVMPHKDQRRWQHLQQKHPLWEPPDWGC